MPSLRDLLDSDIASSLNRSVVEPTGNMLSDLVQSLQNQWKQGEPWRIASGALMMGDPATAKRVIEERFANTTPQDIYEGAMNTGVGMAPMGMAGGLAGIFAGVGAKTADVAKLGLAQEMKAQGLPDAEIWKQTGWTNAYPDNKWRFEIPDNAAKLQEWSARHGEANLPFMQSKNKVATALPTEEFISHPNLEAAYWPTREQSPNVFFNADETASYSPNIDQINMTNRGMIDNTGLSTGLHELQHAIQQREGFARGGSLEQFKSYENSVFQNTSPEYLRYAKALRNGKSIEQLQEEINAVGGKVPDKYLLTWLRDKADLGQYDDAGIVEAVRKGGANEAYQRLAGEAEARLTQARMNLTPEQRLAQYPYDPQYFEQATGVPLNSLIVRNDGGTAMSVPTINPFDGERRLYAMRQTNGKWKPVYSDGTPIEKAPEFNDGGAATNWLSKNREQFQTTSP